MIWWWRRSAYRADVMAQLLMMTLMISPAEGRLLRRHEGIRAAIRTNFEDGVPAMVAATHISAALMTYALEQNDDTIRKQIVEQLLTEWSALEPGEQRAVGRQLAAGTLDQDMLLTRCQWLLLRGQDLLISKKIDLHDFRILKDAIYGPLKGEAHGVRMFDRIDKALDVAFGAGPS